MRKSKVVLPPSTIGIIGGGQLGRMMALAARQMGYRIAVLDPTPNCPTAQIADEQIIAAYDDMAAIKELCELSDVITYEFENVDVAAATYIEKMEKLPQGAYPLAVTQNREKEKQLMDEVGLPVADFIIVHNGSECKKALETFPLPAVIKTCRGGYDGKGQFKIHTVDDFSEVMMFADKNKHCIIEKWLPFDKEIAVVFTRAMTGEITFFPIAENVHKDHILFQTTAPAQVSKEIASKAIEAATKLAEKIGVIGTFAIEMFVIGNEIYVNEMAPRPHNSGHYTIEACNVSQFAQHIKAICGLPLTKIQLLQPAIMINILGEDMKKARHLMVTLPNGAIHLYGKEVAKAKRKMGHITLTAETLDQLHEQLATIKEEK